MRNLRPKPSRYDMGVTSVNSESRALPRFEKSDVSRIDVYLKDYIHEIEPIDSKFGLES